LIAFIIGGAIVAIIANSKGRSSVNWFVYGGLLFPIALVHIIVLSEEAAVGTVKACPECAETVKAEAKICRFC